jgi:hypothetical protein
MRMFLEIEWILAVEIGIWILVWDLVGIMIEIFKKTHSAFTSYVAK